MTVAPPVQAESLINPEKFDTVYSRGKLLGDGAFGRVYLCTHKQKSEIWGKPQVPRAPPTCPFRTSAHCAAWWMGLLIVRCHGDGASQEYAVKTINLKVLNPGFNQVSSLSSLSFLSFLLVRSPLPLPPLLLLLLSAAAAKSVTATHVSVCPQQRVPVDVVPQS